MTRACSNIFRILSVYLVPIFFFFLLHLPYMPGSLSYSSWGLILAVIWMVIWWINEVIPRAITSLLPIILFPYLGIFDHEEMAYMYSNNYSYLFLGGFLLAIAIEKYEIHKFFAIKIIDFIGLSSKKIIISVLVSSFIISTFVTNTATALMMLPFVLSLIDNIKGNSIENKNFKISLLISIAFGATCGGLLTIYGTPSNLILASFIKNNFDVDLYMIGWLKFALPISFFLLITTYFALNWLFPSRIKTEDLSLILSNFISHKLNNKQRIVLSVFVLVCLALLFKPLINIYLSFKLSDETIILTGALTLFMIPANLGKQEFLLHWNDTKKIPWDIILLFGASMAISNSTYKTGLYDYLISTFDETKIIPQFTVILVVVISCLILTEFISNTALSLAILPIIITIAFSTGNNPLIIGIVATISINCAFILCIATPPNSIIMIENHITSRDLAKAGIVIKIAALAIILTSAYLGLFNSYNIDIQLLPEDSLNL